MPRSFNMSKRWNLLKGNYIIITGSRNVSLRKLTVRYKLSANYYYGNI